ncbi:response regulator [Fibrobacter sp. UWB11]|uniref:ATP-binding response regulator n=1 Tax=Fibrobacter sp. UWB11 TaxID=1896202 RepID=UPI00092734D5|nr:response regulator [Fibrobacter sp. UWB11]SIO40264.1 His Kinase A (phospho-acceptor) domain-containing protein [Fibrobacter sp. UWB11]
MIKNNANQQSRIEKSNAIIDSIADEFDCVCYVDLTKTPEDEDVEIFHASQFLVARVPALRGECNLRKRLVLIRDNFVCDEDRDIFYKSTLRDVIVQNLQKNSQYVVPFRCLFDGTEVYFQMSFFADRGEQGLKGFVLRLRNVDRDIRSKQRYELERHLNESIVMKFGEKVESVFVFNPTKNTFRTLYCKEELKGFFPFEGKMDGARGLVAMDIIHPADREMMLKGLEMDNIISRLSREHSFRYLFRDIALGYARWYEVRVMRFDIGDDNEFLVGFVNKNDEVINKKINEKVGEEFSNIDLINLEENIIQVVRRSKYYNDVKEKDILPFEVGFKNASAFVHEEFREQWNEFGSVEKLKRIFAKTDRREIVFKHLTEDGSYFWCRNVFRVLDRIDGVPAMLVMTAAAVDRDQSERLCLSEKLAQQKKELEVNLSIIDVLASEYSSVMYINLLTDEVIPYSMNDMSQHYYDVMIKSGSKYNDAYLRFVNDFVYDADKEKMLEAGDINNIKAYLRNNKTYVILFRSNFAGQVRYSEMKFVKVDAETEEPTAMVVAFADRDDEVSARFVYDKIMAEYEAVLLCDLSNDSAREILPSKAVDFGDKRQRSTCSYRAFRMVQLVDSEYKDEWIRLASPQYIQRLLAHDDRRELIFKASCFRNPWLSFIMQVVERRNGVATLVIMTFATIDKKRAEKIQLNKKIAEQKEELERNISIIEALSAEYTSVYYIDLETEEMTPYSMNKTTANSFGETFKRNVKYSTAYSVYVDKFVSGIYKNRMLQAGSIKNIREQLSTRKSFETMYVNFLNRYCEMKFVKVGDSNHPKFAALGFADKDDILRKEIQQQAVIQGLAEDFDLVCYIDAVSMRENVYRCTDLFPRLFPEWPQIKGFNERLGVIVEKFVSKEDYELFLKSTRRDVILENLKNKNAYYVNFKADVFGHVEYWQIKFVLTATNPVQIVAGFHSVDEETRKQKKDKEALEQALLMANSASRAKTTFLNNMSHDIRTPMNAIIGFTGLATEHIDNKEQVADYLSKISQSSEHLLSLINDVLDMSRIESGKMNITNRLESLSDIIHTLKGIVLSDVRSRKQQFVVELENVHNEMIMCDKLRLNQVLLNVVSNAIKYTPEKGAVSMNIKEVSAEPGYAIYEFLVKDNGIGMNEEFLKQIFAPFTRVNSSTVSGIQGTGLGMSITKNIVDMMGGTINIKSQEQVGTEVLMTFKFKLGEESPVSVASEQFAGLHCLIVNDRPDICKTVAAALKKENLRYDLCMSGDEALACIKKSHKANDDYRLFLIDWNMPEMKGIQITRQIRKVVGTAVPIVVLTSYDWIDIEKEAFEAGVTSFFAKPLFLSDLHCILQKFCGSSGSKIDFETHLSEPKKYDFIGRKVMLVEDNALNREISTEILEDRGVEVTAMERGDLAVEKLKYSSVKYDAILMDIQMPGIDGYEATRQIRAMKDKDISNVPIIAMTANAFDEDKRAAMDAGMNDHVAKPVDVEVLCATLAKFFR